MARVVSFEIRDPEEASFTDRVEYTRHYFARVDAHAGAARALYAFDRGLQYGQPHPDDPIARVKEFRPVQIPGLDRHGHVRFEIEVRWSSDVPEPVNPSTAAADIEWSTTEITRVVTIDTTGRPVVNTAGSLLTDLQEELSLWVVDVAKPITAMPGWLTHYANAVNSDTFKIDGFTAPPRTMKLKQIRLGRWQDSEEFKVRFRELRYQLYYTRETWDRRILNRGLYEIEFRVHRGRTVRDQVPIVNAAGEPLTEPAFLDSAGRRPRRRVRDADGELTDQEELKPQPLDPSDIVVLTFETCQKLPFSVLPRA